MGALECGGKEVFTIIIIIIINIVIIINIIIAIIIIWSK